MLAISDVEHYLSQNGKFCLLDWILSKNILNYSDYEMWRHGKLNTLDKHIALKQKELDKLFELTLQHSETLHLLNQTQEYFCWQEQNPKQLLSSSNNKTHQQLTQLWLRSQNQPQLDLFMDNSAAIAENNLISALTNRQWQQARQHLHKLTEHNPNHHQLGPYLDLVNYGEHMHANGEIPSDAITAELQGLQNEVLPLAKETLGETARDYLAYAWRRIADNLRGVPYSLEQTQQHRSYALQQIPDYSSIEQELNNDPQLYQFAQLLELLAISYFKLKQAEKFLLLWCHIIEIFPEYAELNLEQETTLTIHSLWQHYLDSDENGPLEHFPAFILLKHPGLIHNLNTVEPLKHPATLTMIKLLQLHQMEKDEIHERKQLQKISPYLLQAYLGLNTNTPSK